MDAPILKVFLSREIILREYQFLPDLKKSMLLGLFQNKRHSFSTTFTTPSDHLRIQFNSKDKLTDEEFKLQLLFRKFNIKPGKNEMDFLYLDSLTIEMVQGIPDIVVSDEDLPKTIPTLGIIVLKSQHQSLQRITLNNEVPMHYFANLPEKKYWLIRIEDRYLIKNLESLEMATAFLKSLVIEDMPMLIEICYSGSDHHYVTAERGFVTREQREERKEMLVTAAAPNSINFFERAGHDRYISTNNTLFILGNSLLSDRKTHITSFPLLEYYEAFFTH